MSQPLPPQPPANPRPPGGLPRRSRRALAAVPGDDQDYVDALIVAAEASASRENRSFCAASSGGSLGVPCASERDEPDDRGVDA